MDVIVDTFGFFVEVPDELHIQALYPTGTPEGDPSLDLGVSMEPGSPPDLLRMTGVMLTEHARANPWELAAFVCAAECPPLDAGVFAKRFQAVVESRGEHFAGLTEGVRLGSLPAFEVAWHVGRRISTLRLCWRANLRYSAQLSGFAEKRTMHDAAWRAIMASFELR